MKLTLKLTPAILLTGAMIRIMGTGSAALWHDEAVTLYRSAYFSLFSLGGNNSEQSGDLLLEIILRPLMSISTSVWMLRLPSLLAGLGCLWMVWMLAKRLDFNRTQIVITGILVAFTPGLIWQSQEARAYSMLAFFFLSALWFALESRWYGMTACLGLMLYCHNTAPVFVLAILVVALMVYPWKAPRVILCGVLVGLAYIPQAVSVLQHQNFGGLSLTPLPPLTWSWFVMTLLQALWASTLVDMSTIIVATIGIAMTLVLVFSKVKARGRLVPAVAMVIPFWIILTMSVFWSNFFIYRTVIPLLYPFYLWLGWELGKQGWKFCYRTALAGLWITLIIVGLARFSPVDRGGEVDRVAAEIRSQWRMGDLLVITTQTGIAFDYYLRDLPLDYRPVSANYFMDPPGTPLMYDRPSPTTVTREWIVMPDDILLTAEDRSRLQDMVGNTPPMYVITYMQTSPLMVYLVEK